MDYERTSYNEIDKYLPTPRQSTMGELPAHRQIIYGRTFSARWNRNEFAGIEHYKAAHRFAWSDLGYSLIGLAFFTVIGYGIVRFFL